MCVAVVLSSCAALPVAECPPSPSVPGSQVEVSCADAVAAAVSKLPAGHPVVVRVQVVPGDFRPILGLGGSAAHVVFTYSDRSRVAVALYVDDTTGELIPDELDTY